MLSTRVTRLLGTEYPVIQAGMSVHTSPELVAAVSNAGGLGLVGSVFREPDDLAAVVRAVHGLTDQPFGANVVLAEPWDAYLEILLTLGVPVISTSWGDPAPVVERAHAAGAKVIHQVETVAEVDPVVAAGVDIIVAQGGDGGGHVGRVGTMALVPAVVDAAGDVPVVAAGGIADGRGLAAALLLGAEGVLVGTRFLATTESPVPEGWKQALLAANPEDAWQTDLPDILDEHAWPGATVRVLANRPVRDWQGQEGAVAAIREQLRADIDRAWQAGDAEGYFVYAGQSAGLVHEILPAGEVVRRMVTEAEAALRGVASSLGEGSLP
jgi:NAD(P)H-dependent flavin oxidoreductase YrpB (nitropropane dioxygenase family)